MTLLNMTLVQELLCALLDIYIQNFILLHSPYLCDSFALCLVLNGAVVIELYVIKFASTSNMCFYQVFLFTKNYILLYSPNLCNSNAHGFVLNGAVSIQFTMSAYQNHQNCLFWRFKFQKKGDF